MQLSKVTKIEGGHSRHIGLLLKIVLTSHGRIMESWNTRKKYFQHFTIFSINYLMERFLKKSNLTTYVGLFELLANLVHAALFALKSKHGIFLHTVKYEKGCQILRRSFSGIP